jgi:hypothetical protein
MAVPDKVPRVVATALRGLSHVLNARSTTRSTSGDSSQPYGFVGNGSLDRRLRCSTTEVRRPRLHAPSGVLIRIANISYFEDTNDIFGVQGIDVRTTEACQGIVSVQSFLVIFRFTRVESREPQRKPIGFHVEGKEGSEQAISGYHRCLGSRKWRCR